MDIKFEVDGYKFNVRSSCIIKNKTHSKVLLTNMRAMRLFCCQVEDLNY